MPRGRSLLLALAGGCLFAGVAGGLLRLGVPVGMGVARALAHGALMIGSLGCVIGLERAVAFGGAPALAVPLAAALGTLALLAGWPAGAGVLLLVASGLLVALSTAIVRRQAAPHTVLLTLAAGGWVVGNALFVAAAPAMVVVAWWFAFLVLTVAAERLELTRLMPRRRGAGVLFAVAAALLLAGAILTIASERDGSVVYGGGLVAMSLWLATFDLARRTLRTEGFARYSACALIAGYAWLAIGGLAWIALPWVAAARDTALHAVALGFVVSMIFAHAPLMVPVILRMRMRYTPAVYLPLGLLHASLALRLGAGAFDAHLRQWGGVLNAAAMILFALTVAYGARQKGPAGNPATNSTR